MLPLRIGHNQDCEYYQFFEERAGKKTIRELAKAKVSNKEIIKQLFPSQNQQPRLESRRAISRYISRAKSNITLNDKNLDVEGYEQLWDWISTRIDEPTNRDQSFVLDYDLEKETGKNNFKVVLSTRKPS